MRRRGFIWHLNFYYLLVIVVMASAISWYASRSVSRFYTEKARDDLEATALLVERIVAPTVTEEGGLRPELFCGALSGLSATRVTVVNTAGNVLCDTNEDPERMESHADRPTIARALAGLPAESIRYSETLKKRFMYYSIPLRKDGRVVGALRVSIPLTYIDESLRGIRVQIFVGAFIAVLLAALLSLGLSRRLSAALAAIREGVEGFSRNELDRRIPLSRISELASLADVMNEMAARLSQRMNMITEQRNEQEAVFRSMVEGLLVVDAGERITKINRAAGRFLGLDERGTPGKTIQEAVRNTELQLFVAQALSSEEPVEGDITVIGDGGERLLHAHGSLLLEAGSRKMGAVVVLADVTGLRRLERMRKDFVANVSHELRTPITSIKGFVETLVDGGVRSHEDADKFLTIIGKQADRMNSIVEDLLFLSRVEQDVEDKRIRLEECPLCDVLREAIESSSAKAASRGIRIELACAEDLVAEINPALLEQAVVNLLDNAITYSEPRAPVEVSAALYGGEVLINVRDHGCGIEKMHHERIFERFYRVDRARSRERGGTGLGLAIVKHIVQAHGGWITVESAPGAGSLFTIHLPVRAPRR